MNSKDISKFISFLEKNNALKAYTDNIISPDGYNLPTNRIHHKTSSLIAFLNNYSYKTLEIIDSSLSWSNTSEGRRYWSDLHIQWKHYYITRKQPSQRKYNSVW